MKKIINLLILNVFFFASIKNVSGINKQIQEQSFLQPFQKNSQNRVSPNIALTKSLALISAPSDSISPEKVEKFVLKWFDDLNEVKKTAKASDENFELFIRFNQSYIDSARCAIYQLTLAGKINDSNANQLLQIAKQKIQALYANFLTIEKDYPSSVDEFKSPNRHNVALNCNASCTNIDFSSGNFTGWYGYHAVNSSIANYNITGITGGLLGAVVKGAQDPLTNNSYQVHITSRGNNDWFLKNYHNINMSQASPWGSSNYSAMIGDSVGTGSGVAILSQEFEVTPTNNSLTYAYSVLLENPNHTLYEQPFFSTVILNQNGDTIQSCGIYYVVSKSNLPGFKGEYYPIVNHDDTVYWKSWTQVNVPLNSYVGQCVTIKFEVADCEPSGHFGYAYVSASCTPLAILSSSKVICGLNPFTLTAPAGEKHYLWLGPVNSIIGSDTLQDVTVDKVGTYTAVLTPVTGGQCKDTLFVNVTKDSLAGPTITSTTYPLCYGGYGSASAIAMNGATPYTYSWSPGGDTTDTATGLSAGTYTITISDTNGCSVSTTVIITQPPEIISIGTPGNISCYGASGSASFATTGGVSPYTYSWSNNGTTASQTGLSIGTYSVLVTDATGCSATSSVTVTQPGILLASIGTHVNILCNGGNTGRATVAPTGGTPVYTYSWSPSGGTSATASGLTAGNYTVTVTDAHGCVISTNVSITQPPLLSAILAAPVNILCNGGSNGSASVTASGGAPVYKYSWTPGGGTNAAKTGLRVGTYTVTVTDANSCTVTISVSITQPLRLSVIPSFTPAYCNQSIGSATATVTGGTSPYTYSWAPVAGSVATLTGLSAGNYTVHVTDSNSCTASAVITVTEPTNIVAAANVITNPTCNGGANGSASVSASGGSSPYTYSWSPNGGSGAIATGLTAGTYTVMVTDANGCLVFASVTLTQPPPFNIVFAPPINVLCNGGNNGSASLTVSGGLGPYTYSWSPVVGTANSITGLSAGTYTVSITDAHACNTTASIGISQPPILTAFIGAVVDVSCNAGNDGSATVTAGGGTPLFTYLWTPIGGTNTTATGLGAGSYTVTVTDANGCTATTSVLITQTVALTLITSVLTHVSCNSGTNGSANVATLGGSLPYTYSWTPNGITDITATGLTAGIYTITVTDAHGCSASSLTTITQPQPLSATIDMSTYVLCHGGNNGSASVIANGGTPLYTFSWTPSGGANATATGLSAGIYTVAVTDAHGCTSTANVTITEPLSLILTASVLSNISCNGGMNGSVSATAAGGVSPYTYSWTPNGGNNATVSDLTAGIYTITVKDLNGCSISATITLTQPQPLKATMGVPTNVLCNGGDNGNTSVIATGGVLPYQYSWSPVSGTNSSVTGLSAGTYTVTATDNNACTSTASVIISQPAPLSLTLASTQFLCIGQSGTLSAYAAGGVFPYAYNWSTGATTSAATFIPRKTATYTCTITDANGCTTTSSILINLPPPLILAIDGPTSICSGNFVTLCGNATNGSGGNTFTWNPGNNTNSCIKVSPTATTIYTLMVKDNCGADTTATATVNVNPLPKVFFISTPQQGCSPFCTQFRDLSSIATGKEASWSWQFGNGDSSKEKSPYYCYPTTGNFSVNLTVFSDSGCSSSLNIANMISVYSPPVASFSESPQTSTILAPQIQFTDKSSDAYGIIYRFWTFGDSGPTSSEQNPDSMYNILNPSHTYSDTGTFCPQLVVMDLHGCMDTTSQCLVITPAFSIYIPSAFTPNGDGLNDVFQAKGAFIKSFEMYIFDRWGMELFHSTDINNGWNGTVSRDGMHAVSTVCQEDTYIYQIYVTDPENNVHTYLGQVNLVK